MPRLKNPGYVDCTIPLDEAHVQHLRRIAMEKSRPRARVLYGDLVRQAVEEKLVSLGAIDARVVGVVEALDDDRQLELPQPPRPPMVAPRIGWKRRV